MVGGKKKIVVLNKIDLAEKGDLTEIKEKFKKDAVIGISVKKRENIGLLEKAIRKSILSGGFDQGEGAIVTSARHKEALDKALRSMLSVKKALRIGEPFEIITIDLKEAIEVCNQDLAC